MHLRSLIPLAVLAASTALALGLAPGGPDPADATTPGVQGPIVFSSDQAGGWHLFAVHANGTGLHQLTFGSGSELTPAYSPDGRHIAFSKAAVFGVPGQIWVMDADGAHAHRVSHDGGSDWMPSWSPDGRRIVFGSYSGAERIAVVDASGAHQHFLTPGLSNDADPEWSTDGRRIAFATDRWTPGRTQLALMRPDGSHVVRLTDDTTSDTSPAWSPTNVSIAYGAFDGSSSSMTIDVIDTSGLAATPLTTRAAGIEDEEPTWSPDGRRVLFSRYQSATTALYTVDPYGGSPHALPLGYATQDSPSWGTVPVRCDGRWATIGGTSGYDVLMGTRGADVISARGGGDTVLGLGGNDVICGGGGDDDLVGGAGNDVVVGGPGADLLYGNAGDDLLVARDRHRDPGISCGSGGGDRATWDHGLDPRPTSC